MSLGGGFFTVQNKILPGAYINFMSKARASAVLSERGVATMPLQLDWGPDGEVFEVTPADLQKNSLRLFGYAYTHPKLKGLRDLFSSSIRTLYTYRLNSGGKKASCPLATAKYSGIRGNDLRLVLSPNVDVEGAFDVRLYLDNNQVYEQEAVTSAAELLDCDYVDWAPEATLEASAGLPLQGGTNGSADGAAHQAYLDKIEAYSFNIMGVVAEDKTTKALYAAYTKRLREQVGAKFQLVLYDYAANHEGVINVCTKALGSDSPADLVYWVTGAQAACAVNRTLLNRAYDGEFTPDLSATQSQLERALLSGQFVLHSVNGQPRVLEDINSLVHTCEDKDVESFGKNQVIRVLDQIANDIATVFATKYLGSVPNDAPGRVSLWNDIVKHHQQLQKIRAIQNFEPDDILVSQGEQKDSVVVQDAVEPVLGMAKLYMTVIIV